MAAIGGLCYDPDTGNICIDNHPITGSNMPDILSYLFKNCITARSAPTGFDAFLHKLAQSKFPTCFIPSNDLKTKIEQIRQNL